MSKNEIIKVLSKLTPKERREIRAKIDELDDLDLNELDEDDLTEEEWKLIDERIAEYKKNPHTSIPWSEIEARHKARYKI
jgi:hypothetical protein